MTALTGGNVLNIADLRRLAQRRVPRVVFDYIDGGAEAEVTMRANASAFEEVTLRPRGAVAIASPDLRTKALGQDLASSRLRTNRKTREHSTIRGGGAASPG